MLGQHYRRLKITAGYIYGTCRNTDPNHERGEQLKCHTRLEACPLSTAEWDIVWTLSSKKKFASPSTVEWTRHGLDTVTTDFDVGGKAGDSRNMAQNDMKWLGCVLFNCHSRRLWRESVAPKGKVSSCNGHNQRGTSVEKEH